LALIIFVVSEKKAFEHFPIGSNVNLFPVVGENVSKRFFSQTTWTIETKLPRNNHLKVLLKVWVFMPIRNPRWLPPQVIVLTQDHMGKYRNIFFSEAIALIEPKLCINH
jgi:hypothetical protein